MGKVVKKTVVSSEITVSKIVVEDGRPVIVDLQPLVLNKKIASLSHAEREVKKADQYKELFENKERIIVSGYENMEDTYVMSQTDFMKYGTIELDTELEMD